MRLIYKRRDRADLKNWRPVSSLCTDYKIFAKVLARRLGSVMTEVVHSDQTCSVPGRSILTNCFLIRDLVEIVENEDIEAAIISLDNEKAFDRLEWGFMFGVLDRLGFGPVFQRWIRLIYRNPASRVIVNNHIGDPCRLHRGVRQGCPLSPLLYVLAAEVLGAAVRASTFRGVTLPSVEEPVKISVC